MIIRRDTGQNLYRRSLYTFWKRSAPPASMEIFNAPTRETCTVRRERTDTPLQALVTLNDPQFVEAARHLAQRRLQQGGDNADARLDFIARRLLGRPLRAEESQAVQASLNDLLAYYQSHADDAKLLAVGESPARRFARRPDPRRLDHGLQRIDEPGRSAEQVGPSRACYDDASEPSANSWR